MNAGAGQGLTIEQLLVESQCDFICDRVDEENCQVDFQKTGNCWQVSIEDMRPVYSDRYSAVFAKYVLEHVSDLRRASREIFRVAAPGGLFITTIPNTGAPEFIIARYTPLWFHKLFHDHVWKTFYSYRTIREFIDVFSEAGFQFVDEKRWPVVGPYLRKYPILRELGQVYDKAVGRMNLKFLMGNAGLSFRKPA